MTPFKQAQNTSTEWMSLSRVIQKETNQIDVLRRQLQFNNTQKMHLFKNTLLIQSKSNDNLLRDYQEYKKK